MKAIFVCFFFLCTHAGNRNIRELVVSALGSDVKPQEHESHQVSYSGSLCAHCSDIDQGLVS